jgi:hypothetical protein
MKNGTTTRASGDDASLESGKVLGQSIAFGIIAGRCSAAQAAAIRQLHHDKVHTRFGLKWREFCPKHLKMSGSQADVIIRLLEEFGPDYFEHTQSVRISADTYRLVSPLIHDKVLHYGEELLELNSANVQKVAESLRESQPKLPPPAEPETPALADRLAALNVRTAETMAELRNLGKDCHAPGADPLYGLQFRTALIRMDRELKRVSRENDIA